MISKEQLEDLVKRIRDRTGLGQEEISLSIGYKVRTLTELLSKGEKLDSAHTRLMLKYGETLKDSTSTPKGAAKKTKLGHFTPDQLFAMYMSSVERQDRLMEAQTAILKSIENTMARADAQTTMNEKLEEISASLADSKEVDLLAAKHQEEKFAEIANLLLQGLSSKKHPSLGAGKRQGENGGGVDKPRKKS